VTGKQQQRGAVRSDDVTGESEMVVAVRHRERMHQHDRAMDEIRDDYPVGQRQGAFRVAGPGDQEQPEGDVGRVQHVFHRGIACGVSQPHPGWLVPISNG